MGLHITNEDNMILMARYPDKYFPLAVLDPEYGIGEAGKNHKSRNTLVRQKGGQLRRCPSTNYEKSDWDDKPADVKFFAEVNRVSVNQVIFGANYFESIMPVRKPPRRAEYDLFLRDNPVGFILWDKVNGTSDFSDCEVIYTSFTFKSYVLPYMWAGMMQGVSISSGTVMQGNKSLNEKRIHPTQKPVIIYKYLLKEFSVPGQVILDTNTGSGSIALACHDYGVDLVGCEKHKNMWELSMKRIEQHTNQQKLFI